ncbi:MAG TPA: hypothetical protein VFO83_15885, partial [Aggregicoccus sp.]|nr:hypothetical protein [Aggregicoccus sp.]
ETRIAPWLAVGDGAQALSFYKEAFGAVEVERLEDGGRVVVAKMHEAHGWRTGRITDPFGHDWELSRRVTQ